MKVSPISYYQTQSSTKKNIAREGNIQKKKVELATNCNKQLVFKGTLDKMVGGVMGAGIAGAWVILTMVLTGATLCGPLAE